MSKRDLRVTFARKSNIRQVQTTTTPPNQLNLIVGIRKLEDRKKFQWKVIFEDGSEREFLNFRQLQSYANSSARGLNRFIILTRSDRNVPDC